MSTLLVPNVKEEGEKEPCKGICLPNTRLNYGNFLLRENNCTFSTCFAWYLLWYLHWYGCFSSRQKSPFISAKGTCHSMTNIDNFIHNLVNPIGKKPKQTLQTFSNYVLSKRSYSAAILFNLMSVLRTHLNKTFKRFVETLLLWISWPTTS